MTRPATGPAGHRVAVAGWVGLVVGAAVLAGALGGPPAADPDAAVQVATVVTRAGLDAAAVACVGLTLLGVLLPLGAGTLPGSALRDLVRVQDTADRAVVVVAGGWLVLVLTGIAFRAANAVGRTVGQLSAADVGAWATRLSAGRGMLLTAGCVAVVLGCGIARLRRRDAVQVRVPMIAALLGALMPALTGHTGSAPDHQLAVISAALHVAAASLWVGGLGAILVLVARHRALLDAVLPRFSALAGGCVLAVAATGVVNAATRLEGWAALVGTGYGQLVLAKVALLGLLAGLGGLARRRLRAGRRPVLRWAGLEVALMALTMGVAAALTQTG
ncbi:copper resistance D family protein [Pseudonocardia humida]|uniref:CopD family protein n=1 Tax=Pseudonocardia humida TaxID=2800819 RepID=A0ABT1A4S0_9PSEU|nr:CopD family protein [Pseudonocardia humida]MCO1658001.1 CopD family protein [Pseudonocardia humida]